MSIESFKYSTFLILFLLTGIVFWVLKSLNNFNKEDAIFVLVDEENDRNIIKSEEQQPEPSNKNDDLIDGPIIVGGIGDSGTRGIYQLLSMLDIDMMPELFVKTISKDSILWMNSEHGDWKRGESRLGIEVKKHIWDNGNKEGIRIIRASKELTEFQREKGLLTSSPTFFSWEATWRSGNVNRSGSFVDYKPEDINQWHPKMWDWGVNQTAGILLNHRKVAQTRVHNYPTKLYGFKHPRTALMLPFINDAVKRLYEAKLLNPLRMSKNQIPWKFIHVIRDGYDVAFSGNTNMYDQLCCAIYHLESDPRCIRQVSGTGKRCEQRPAHFPTEDPRNPAQEILPENARWHAMQLQFHQDTNAQVMIWGMKNLGLEKGYFPLRIEDFVFMEANNTKCLERLLDFLELPKKSVLENKGLIRKLIRSFAHHRPSYGGKSIHLRRQKIIVDIITKADQRSNKTDYWGQELFGYHDDRWGVRIACDEWLDRLPNLVSNIVDFKESSGEYVRKQNPPRSDWRERHK